jgi:hypothetical protein
VNDSSASLQHPGRSLLASRLPLLGLILLAFALRVYRLPAQSVWYDEGVSWYMTRLSLPALTLWTANDIQPPLYYYLLWPWVRLAGAGEYALRFPSVFFGALSVPLLWIFAQRLLGSGAARLAALFMAVAPLQVYYAQEARMYTLLTWLGLLSSYLLWRLLNGRPGRSAALRGWAYILVSAAALYTHYFAFFLLAAHAVYVLYRWLRAGAWPGPAGRKGVLIPAAILLLYLPWLPFQFARYSADASYWAGRLQIGEVARKLFVAFGPGETVTERAGNWLALGYAAILVVSLAALGMQRLHGVRRTPASRPPAHRASRDGSRVFLLLYFLVPVALVLLLAYRAPKFNPRYAMLASPAFLLLLAGGLAALITPAPSPAVRRPSKTTHHASRITHHASRLIFAGSVAFILAASISSLANWFQPYPANQFNKADFRITAEIVGQRIGPGETVLLSSGHMFPAWAYYYGWNGWHRLPDVEILDVNAALDLTVGGELERLLQGKRGVWLVRWQNEVTDPFDVLPLYLGSAGLQDDYGQFWHMELFHYRLPAGAHFGLDHLIGRRAEVDFGGRARLLGMRQISDRELVLFWQALAGMEADYTVLVHVLDAGGQTLANADHLPPRPTREWRPGQILPDRVTLSLPPGLPPGEYQIEVGLYQAHAPGMPRLPVGDESGGRALLPLHLAGQHESAEVELE